jgi:VIT1/CCC1 family predicted Fe2+/Mn2+ transporter
VETLGDLVALVVGGAIGLVIIIPLASVAITVAITLVALQVAIVGAIVGYLIGIPWSIWFRWHHGRWPES